MKGIWGILPLVLLAAAATNVANAGIIQIEPVPDIDAVYLDIAYDGSTYTVQGFANSLTAVIASLPPVQYFISYDDPFTPTFTLTAQISSAGVATGGALNIYGCLNDFPDSPGCPGAGLLLQSTSLVDFGFEPFEGGEIFFSFDGLTGALAPLFGEKAYVKVNTSFALPGDTFPGNFSAPFTNSDIFSNVADTGVTPEPGTWVFLATGLGCLCLGRRKIRRS